MNIDELDKKALAFFPKPPADHDKDDTDALVAWFAGKGLTVHVLDAKDPPNPDKDGHLGAVGGE